MYEYPKVKKVDQVDNYFGIEVADPYRWLEDDQAPETQQFVDDQVGFYQDYIRDLPQLESVKDRLTDLYDYDKYGDFRLIKDQVLYSYNSGLQDQYVWYIQDGLEGEARVLLDPNSLSQDGTVAISLKQASPDGRYLAYSVASAGSDWQTVKILDLQEDTELNDQIDWVKFTNIAWQGQGFYYSAYETPTEGQELSATSENERIYYHQLGSAQAEDRLVYEDPAHPLRYNRPYTSRDGATVLIESSEGTYGTQYLIYDEDSQDFQLLLEGFDHDHWYIGKFEDQLLFLSDQDAPNKQVLAYHLESESWSSYVQEADYSLEWASVSDDYLILAYLVDASSRIEVIDLRSEDRYELDLPGLGSVYQVQASRDLKGLLYSFQSFTQPTSFYFYDFSTQASSIFKASQLQVDTSDFITERHFVQASDGAQVPIFLTRRKDLALDGQRPTLLYAYGGYSVAMTPSFSASNLYLLEQGGIYAQACIRGGAEYGEDWHRQGMLLNKQRVFDDFIECSQWLIDQGYTSVDKLAIEGASNGGLLMGAVMNQRPDLYRVGYPAVGVMDMLRYHLFTVGWGWVVEFGSPEEEVHFHNLLAYSPLHNIETKDYPSVMITTADHDDRVVPAHSYKYAARLQELNTSDNPILLRIDKNSGHGAGKSTGKIIAEQSEKWAFMLHEMDL